MMAQVHPLCGTRIRSFITMLVWTMNYLKIHLSHLTDAACGTTVALDQSTLEENIAVESSEFSVEAGARTDDAYTPEEGEWIPDENDLIDEGAYQDEENQRALYGQVTESDELVTPFLLVDLLDWKIARGIKRNVKVEVARLIGRLVLVTSALQLINTTQTYRDRAAERRVLHGGFGVGPGQISSPFNVDSAPSSPVSDNHEVAAAESLNMSFGAGSYARKILESMGWQEGETLGNSVKGLMEPLQAVGDCLVAKASTPPFSMTKS